MKISLLYPLLFFSLFIFSCKKTEIITETVIVTDTLNADITGYVYRGKEFSSFGINNYGYQHIDFTGFNPNSSFDVKFNSLNLDRKDNINTIIFKGQNFLNYNQQCSLNIKIDDLSGNSSGTIPDSIKLLNINNGDLFPEGQDIFIDWDDVDCNYYFIHADIRYSDNEHLLLDTSIVIEKSEVLLPSKLFITDFLTDVEIYAINGSTPNHTKDYNLNGDLIGNIYYYTLTTISVGAKSNKKTLMQYGIKNNKIRNSFKQYIENLK